MLLAGIFLLTLTGSDRNGRKDSGSGGGVYAPAGKDSRLNCVSFVVADLNNVHYRPTLSTPSDWATLAYLGALPIDD